MSTNRVAIEPIRAILCAQKAMFLGYILGRFRAPGRPKTPKQPKIGRRKGTYIFWVHNMVSKLFRREKNEKCPPIGSPLGRFGRYFVPKKLCFWATFWAGSGPWGGPKSPQKSPPKVFPDSGRNHQKYYVYVLFCPLTSADQRPAPSGALHLSQGAKKHISILF